jgi:hypothetical protein
LIEFRVSKTAKRLYKSAQGCRGFARLPWESSHRKRLNPTGLSLFRKSNNSQFNHLDRLPTTPRYTDTTPSARERTGVYDSEVAPEHRAKAREHRAKTPEHRATTSEHRAMTPEHRAMTPEHRAMTPAHRAMTPAHRAMTSEHRATTPEHRAKTSEHRAKTPEHRATTPEHRAATPEHSRAAVNQGGVSKRAGRVPSMANFFTLWLRALQITQTKV